MAVLPDGSELLARLEQPSSYGADSAYGYVFDRQLPKGSTVYLNGWVIYAVGHRDR